MWRATAVGGALGVTALLAAAAGLGPGPAGAQTIPEPTNTTDPPVSSSTQPPLPTTTAQPTTTLAVPTTAAPTTTAAPPPTTAGGGTTTERTTTSRPPDTIATTTTPTFLPPPPTIAPTTIVTAQGPSAHLPAVFPIVGVTAWVIFLGLVAAQWWLTRPGRPPGGRTL